VTPVPTSAPASLAAPRRGGAAVGRGRFDAGLTRLGLRTALARDWALAVVLALVTGVGLALLTGPLSAELDVQLEPPRRALFLVVSVAQALALGVRRTRPPVCLLLVTGLQVLVTATVASEATVRGLPVLVAFYTAGAYLPLRRLLRWGGLALALEIVCTPFAERALRSLLPVGPTGDPAAAGLSVWAWAVGAASVVVLYGAAAAAGVTVATRRRNVALLEARAAAVEAEREADTRRAVEAERLRMARELHDVAAHHLTGLLVQASAAERLVVRDQDAARRAILEVREQGKQALDNLRAVVGVLRHDDGSPGASPAAPSPELGPVPGLAVLPDLVAAARGLGDEVTVTVSGTSFALPPVADVTAYRVAQEALSNARQHAPGQAVDVELAYRDAEVRLSVVNAVSSGPTVPRSGGRDGFGLAGMHERAALVGATLAAGPVRGPAWRVTLVLPRPGLGTVDDR
jgi:signal transduction histidine kinase